MAGERRLRIRDARLIDGTGAPAVHADILVESGRVLAIEPYRAELADLSSEVIDAAGRVVAPGFIDVHSHADNAPLLAQDDCTKIRQGVTTEVTGNCGKSLAPMRPGDPDALSAITRLAAFEYTGWTTSAELFALIDERGSVANVCPLVGHGTLRTAVTGTGRSRLSASDLAEMTGLLRGAVEAGAFGLSSGLIYPPGVYSTAEELRALVGSLPADRIYTTHMRNESDGLLSSIDESLAAMDGAACRLEISHLKSTGKPNAGRTAAALAVLDRARADGVRVTHDVYPYDAASTMLSACLPPWALDGTDEVVLGRLADPVALRRMRAQIDAGLSTGWDNLIEGAGGYDGILVVSTDSGRFEGSTVAEIALELSLEPFDALVHVLAEERLSVRMVEFCMSERDVETVLRSPWTSIGSDGLPPGLGGRQHPRLYGTFPRLLGRFVRERGVLTLPEAIRRMTSLPAEVFRVPDRGTVRAGAIADLVCFDPGTVGHAGTYLDPAVPPSGICWVMMNGRLAVRDNRWLGVRLGRRLQPG